MRITAIRRQIKNTERVSVMVDGKYSFSLSLDELVRHKLKTGDELDAPDIKKFQKISEDGKARARSLAWVLNRPHSTREFMDYMRRKKVDDELTEQLRADFSAKNYLNDETYASWLIDLRSRAGKSNRAIKSELLAKGISREVAEDLLDRADDEAERLHELVSKKKHQPRYKNDLPRLIKYLTSQGFPYQLVIRELKINGPQH